MNLFRHSERSEKSLSKTSTNILNIVRIKPIEEGSLISFEINCMKIPNKAKKVFEGVIFDIYQWQQEMYDGSTATFEMLDRDNTIQVIATMDDKIILINEKNKTV